jgi:hypothetical protein
MITFMLATEQLAATTGKHMTNLAAQTGVTVTGNI